MGINAGVQIPKWNRRKGRFLFWYGMRGAHDVRGKGIVTTWLTAGGCRIDDIASTSRSCLLLCHNNPDSASSLLNVHLQASSWWLPRSQYSGCVFYTSPKSQFETWRTNPWALKQSAREDVIACKGTFTFYNVSSWFKTHTHYWRAKGVSAS